MEQKYDELLKKWQILYKRKYLFVVLFIILTTTVIVWSHFLPKKYEANSTVFIEENVIKNLVKGIAVTPEMDDKIRVLQYALLSRELIAKVLNEMDINDKTRSPEKLQDLVSSIRKRTKIYVKGKDLFTVSFVDQDPEFAQQFTNRLIQRYLEDNISSKRKETYGANRFLDEQITLFKGKLDKAEDALIKFRKKHNIYVTDDEKTILEEIKKYSSDIDNIELNLDTLHAKKNQFKKQLMAIHPTVDIFSQQQKNDRILTMENKIKQLLVTYTGKYPEVVKLRAQVQALKSQQATGDNSEVTQTKMTSVNPVFQDVQQKAFELDSDISAQRAKLQRLKQLLAQRKMEIRTVPENRKKIAMLVQERDSLKRIYDQLLMRMGQSEVSKQMEIGDKTTNFRVVDPALYPTEPISPDMVKMILLALLVGIGGGIGGVLLADNLDGTVRGVEDIQDLGVDVLAVIPKIRDHAAELNRRRKDLLVYGLTAVYFSGVVCLLAYEAVKRLV